MEKERLSETSKAFFLHLGDPSVRPPEKEIGCMGACTIISIRAARFIVLKVMPISICKLFEHK